MDDLTFRRTIYADPNCQDKAVLEAAAADPAKQEFWNELKSLENRMQGASKVSVPDGMAHRLLLRQSIKQHATRKKRTRVHLALAASFAFVAGATFTLWQQTAEIDLGQHALAHVYHEADGFALKVNGDVSLTDVNEDLTELGAQLAQNVGRIYFATFCRFDKVKSYHMVFEGEHGKVTVFLVPREERYRPIDRFSDDRLYGETLTLQNAHLIMVGEKGDAFDTLKSNLTQNLRFSA